MNKIFTSILVCILLVTVSGCGGQSHIITPEKVIYIEKSVEAYERIGIEWGEKLRREGRQPNELNEDFVKFLLWGKRMIPNSVDDKTASNFYFQVDATLKDAFKRGFRKGFESREADLVLGPHITAAAGKIAERNAAFFETDVKDYVLDQRKFQREFSRTLEKSVDIFKELIAEGSPADREKFKLSFKEEYKRLVEVYLKNTPFYVSEYKYADKSKYISTEFSKKRIPKWYRGDFYKSFFGVLKVDEMWKLLYYRSLFAVGQEMGQKFGHNLIVRAELLDWLRRTRDLLSVQEMEMELGILYDGFDDEYNKLAKNSEQVWKDLLNDIKN